MTNLLLILLLPVLVNAQDGSGRSETTEKKSGSSTASPRKKIRPVRKSVPDIPVVKPPETGRLGVLINGGGSQFHLSQAGSVEKLEVISIPTSGSSFISRTLPVGGYTILVKKPGFFDEIRTVYITAGKRKRIEINMRPMMALLSVRSSVADARIEIDRIGTFNAPVRKYFVKPGTYRVNIQRRGYLSRTITVDLRKAGQEKNINLVLQPLRIDSVLDLASDRIKSGAFSEAADLTNDVLILNAAHARANFLYGLIEYGRGDLAAISYFLKAIRNGETVVLPVKIFEGAELYDAEVLFDRDGISIRNRARFEMNYKIAKAGILDLQSSSDTPPAAHVVLNGKSDFHGRPIEPHLRIYSRNIVADSDLGLLRCQTNPENSCTVDADILFKLISDWRLSDNQITGAVVESSPEP